MTKRPFARRKFDGKIYQHFDAADNIPDRDARKAAAKKRYKLVRVLKPNSPTEPKYIIYVRDRI